MAHAAQTASKRRDDASTAALQHCFCSGIGGWGDTARPEAAAGPTRADAQPTMRTLQQQSPQHPNFCSLFKRGFYQRLCFYIPCDPSCSRALAHDTRGTMLQVSEMQQISPSASPRASRAR